MINTVLFGAGKLGSIHLQAFSQVKITNLYVVDSNPKSLELARERFDEIAPSVSFLLSSDSSYITGHNLIIDRDWTAI